MYKQVEKTRTLTNVLARDSISDLRALKPPFIFFEMKNPISSESDGDSSEIEPECEIHSEESESSSEVISQNVAPNEKKAKIDLYEQDNEFITEARESLLR